MKVKIGEYKNFIGPYQIAKAILFWRKDEFMNDDPLIQKFGDWLAYKNGKVPDTFADLRDNENMTWLNKFCNWIYSKQKRTVKIKIDEWDAWNADDTLALIIYPLLLEVKKSKQGAPNVDDEDVPKHLRSTENPVKEGSDVDIAFFDRYEWVLDEMIWFFKMQQPDQDDFLSYYKDGKFDIELYTLHENRMKCASILFGKYYRSLWT